ncbi:MAG: chromosome partitioning protein ParB [Deltaproteobacteria bacterium CG11_big_fil_rev_8_21_14_0_20_47_16]|nr:MAG: chromosome partitioning protein ParB [Deltaproteobacteria bacterium CG11_big_fil_rev_8_21_14_0_20_47_16]
MQPRKALGKGLASLITTGPPAPRPVQAAPAPMAVTAVRAATEMAPKQALPQNVAIDAIVPNHLQPRKHFDEDALTDLANSIKVHGVIQPLVVNPLENGRYELIAGERRWRASKRAGLTEVPVVLKKVDNETLLELAIIENIQRQDLDALEEANAYQELINQFNYSQEQVADKVGKSRSAVSNSLRLLNLPKLIQEDIALGRLSAGHARALLALENLQDQLTIREQVLHAQLSVRDLERMVQLKQNRAPSDLAVIKKSKREVELAPQWKQVQEDLTMALGTKVLIQPDNSMKGGKVVVEFYSAQDLSRIHDLIVERT